MADDNQARVEAIRAAGKLRDCDPSLVAHLVARPFPEADAVEAIEAFAAQQYWVSPYGEQWGETPPAEVQ